MNQNDILQVIIENIRQILPELDDHAFEPSDSMRALGFNSVDRSELAMMVLEHLNLKVALAELASAQTIGELAGVLYAKSQA